MAAVALTAAQIAAIHQQSADIVDMIATETITAGQAVYTLTTGLCGVAGAAGAGKQQIRGIALRGGAAGAVIPVLRRGECFGFTVSGLNGDAIIYLSDTLGGLDTGAGTMTVRAGRVALLPDGSGTKVLFVDCPVGWLWT